MRVEILGQERRRRWRGDEKLAIVMSVGTSGATITEVAHRHDITRQQIYAWRSELKKKGLVSTSSNALFIPVDVKAVQMDVADDRERSFGMIELRLSCGRTIRFDIEVDTAALTRREALEHFLTDWRSGLSCVRDHGHAQLCGDYDYAESETPTGALAGFSVSFDST